MPDKTFKEALEELINGCSLENGSNTPDFLLAEHLSLCLKAYETTVNARDKWYGFEPNESLYPTPKPS